MQHLLNSIYGGFLFHWLYYFFGAIRNCVVGCCSGKTHNHAIRQ